MTVARFWAISGSQWSITRISAAAAKAAGGRKGCGCQHIGGQWLGGGRYGTFGGDHSHGGPSVDPNAFVHPTFADVALLVDVGADESTYFLDVSQYRHGLAPIGTAKHDDTTVAITGDSSSIELDGNSDGIAGPDHAVFDLINVEYMLDAWVKVPVAGGGKIITKYDATGNFRAFQLYVNKTDGLPTFTSYGQKASSSSSATHIIGTTDMRDDAWHHILIHREYVSGTAPNATWNFRLFIDGVIERNTQLVFNTLLEIDDTNSAVHIGTDVQRTNFFDGRIAWPRIVKGSINEQLTGFTPPVDYPFDVVPVPEFSNVLYLPDHEDVADESTSINDNSGNAYSFTYVGNAKNDDADTKFGSGTSILLDGTGDYLSKAYTFAFRPDSSFFDDTDELCFEFHIKFNALNGNTSFYSRYMADTNRRMWQIKCDVSKFLQFTGYDAGGSGDIFMNLKDDTALLTGQWYHVAGTRQNRISVVAGQESIYRLFKDGVIVDSIIVDEELGFNSDGQIGPRFGAQESAGNETVNGRMDNIRIVIGEPVYVANFTPPTARLLLS